MWIEAVAAGLVGLALLTLVLAPLLSGRPPEPVPHDEPEELDETRHGAALLALKEIEFDRATGKLSEEDYGALKAKYTLAALAALRDGQPGAGRGHPDAGDERMADGEAVQRAQHGPGIEELVAKRRAALESGGMASETCPVCGPRPEADALYCSACGRRLEAAGRPAVA